MSPEILMGRFLAAIDCPRGFDQDAMDRLGIDDLTVGLCFAEARRRGFVTPEGTIPAVTPAARAWAHGIAAPFLALGISAAFLARAAE